MLRKVIQPNERNISIELPQNFVGKQVEVLAFTIDETIGTSISEDGPLTHFVSEKSLSRDWLTSEEDEVWRDL